MTFAEITSVTKNGSPLAVTGNPFPILRLDRVTKGK